jgi:sarcosine oxidase
MWNHELWQRLEHDAGQPLRWPRGLIWRGGLATEVAAALAVEGIEHEVIDQAKQAELFPELRWRPEMEAVWQPDAGVVQADRALQACAGRLTAHGGRLVSGATASEIVQAGSGSVTVIAEVAGERVTFEADRVLVTAGPWAGPLLASLGVHVELTPVLAQVTYVRGGDVAWADRPCVIEPPAGEWSGSFGSYLMPTPDLGFKIGIDDPVAAFDPDNDDRTPSDLRQQQAVALIKSELPAFDATPIRSEVCAWTESADDAFVIDRVGQVVFGCGDSGQGFKFLPMFGQVFADLIEERPLPEAVASQIAAFGLERFVSDAASR